MQRKIQIDFRCFYLVRPVFLGYFDVITCIVFVLVCDLFLTAAFSLSQNIVYGISSGKAKR